MLIYRIYYLLYSTAAILLSSCQNPVQDHITQLVEEWQGKEVLCPENPVFTRQLKDTVDYRIPDGAYRLCRFGQWRTGFFPVLLPIERQ